MSGGGHLWSRHALCRLDMRGIVLDCIVQRELIGQYLVTQSSFLCNA